MKAIISPYEEIIINNEMVNAPAVFVDLGGIDFTSSDLPKSILDSSNNERLVYLNEENETLAIALGYIGVDA